MLLREMTEDCESKDALRKTNLATEEADLRKELIEGFRDTLDGMLCNQDFETEKFKGEVSALRVDIDVEAEVKKYDRDVVFKKRQDEERAKIKLEEDNKVQGAELEKTRGLTGRKKET